jgi:hypothetical protein
MDLEMMDLRLMRGTEASDETFLHVRLNLVTLAANGPDGQFTAVLNIPGESVMSMTLDEIEKLAMRQIHELLSGEL